MLGKLGDNQLPWSGSLGPDAITNSIGSSNQGEFKPVIADNAQGPAGFKIEKIFQVPRSMGSWVALTIDPKGRLIASDQGRSRVVSKSRRARTINRRAFKRCQLV